MEGGRQANDIALGWVTNIFQRGGGGGAGVRWERLTFTYFSRATEIDTLDNSKRKSILLAQSKPWGVEMEFRPELMDVQS